MIWMISRSVWPIFFRKAREADEVKALEESASETAREFIRKNRVDTQQRELEVEKILVWKQKSSRWNPKFLRKKKSYIYGVIVEYNIPFTFVICIMEH